MLRKSSLGAGLLACSLLSACETAVDVLVGSQIDGVWKGQSHCGFGLPINTTLDLSLAGSVAQGKITEAIPRGNLDPPGPDRMLGVYTLQGTFDAPNMHLVLQPVTKIEAGVLPAWEMRTIDAILRTDGKTLEIKQMKNCTESLLTKQ